MIARFAFAASLALLSAASFASQAHAWGCTAVDSQGAYGYSYNWPDEQDAEMRALDECEARSNTHDCQTDQCDPNG